MVVVSFPVVSKHTDPLITILHLLAALGGLAAAACWSWAAAPASFSERALRKSESGGELTGVVLLPDEYDPALSGPRSNEVEWRQFTLNAGDVLYIPRGWWHSVRAIQGSIGLAIETRHSSGAAWKPTKFANVGRTRNRRGWRSAARCMLLLAAAAASSSCVGAVCEWGV